MRCVNGCTHAQLVTSCDFAAFRSLQWTNLSYQTWVCMSIIGMLRLSWPIKSILTLTFTCNCCAETMRPPKRTLDAYSTYTTMILLVCKYAFDAHALAAPTGSTSELVQGHDGVGDISHSKNTVKSGDGGVQPLSPADLLALLSIRSSLTVYPVNGTFASWYKVAPTADGGSALAIDPCTQWYGGPASSWCSGLILPYMFIKWVIKFAWYHHCSWVAQMQRVMHISQHVLNIVYMSQCLATSYWHAHDDMQNTWCCYIISCWIAYCSSQYYLYTSRRSNYSWLFVHREGVGCEGGQVVSLILRNMHLRGTLPKFREGDLRGLETLDMSHNQIKGSIDASLANLISLRHFRMVRIIHHVCFSLGRTWQKRFGRTLITVLINILHSSFLCGNQLSRGCY